MNLYVLNISHEWGLFLMQFTLLLSGCLFFFCNFELPCK